MLEPGQGIEIKLVMEEGAVAPFEWAVEGGEVNFDLHGDGSGNEPCTAKDISLSGMFLQCSPAFGRTGDIVSLEFWLGFGGINKRCCMLVQIARVADDGFGVCYHQCDAASFRYVHQLMYERGASYREAFG